MTNAEAIIKYHYWLYNHADAKEILTDVFGECLGKHFYGEFLAKCESFDRNTWAAWVDLLMEMTTDNQAKLAEYLGYEDWEDLENHHAEDE